MSTMGPGGQPLDMRGRVAKGLVEETLQDTPITVIQGARQVGKSTLARAVTSERPALMLSLDTAAVYQAAKADPDGFVRQSDDLLVIDEVQRVPELVLALKDAVEEDRRPGRFLITGSANLLEHRGAQESRAARAATGVSRRSRSCQGGDGAAVLPVRPGVRGPRATGCIHCCRCGFHSHPAVRGPTSTHPVSLTVPGPV